MNVLKQKVRLTQWASCAGCASKMDAHILSEALSRIAPSRDPAVLVGIQTSDDAGVYRISEDMALISTVDFFPPVLDDPYDYGRVAAANALSDVYAMGGHPLTALNIVGFPGEGLASEVLHEILRGGAAKLEEAGVALVGGHSVTDPEVKYGLAVTGVIDPARIVANAGARPGDCLILTKPIGVGIVATALKQGQADEALVRLATGIMARLNRPESELMLTHDAHACTDITGYGLLGHALEMARASHVRLEIEHHQVPHIPGALELIARGILARGLNTNRRAFGAAVRIGEAVSAEWQGLLYDPQTSGGLLIALPEVSARDLLQRLADEGIPEAAIIGCVLPGMENEAPIAVK